MRREWRTAEPVWRRRDRSGASPYPILEPGGGLFHGPGQVRECLGFSGLGAPQRRLFERFQMAMNLSRHHLAGRRKTNYEAAAIVRADLAADQPALGQAVEKTGQGRAFMGEGLVQFTDGAVARARQMCQDMRFALI